LKALRTSPPRRSAAAVVASALLVALLARAALAKNPEEPETAPHDYGDVTFLNHDPDLDY